MAMFRFKTDLVPCTKLDPWFVTGFSDAESSFMINITKRPENKVGWMVSARFVIYLADDKNLSLLNLIKSYFEDSGSVILDKKTNKASFTISKFSDLTNLIIPHFQKFPLQSSKLIEYSLWLNCIKLMENNEHLTQGWIR